jgi:hypothetical protein
MPEENGCYEKAVNLKAALCIFRAHAREGRGFQAFDRQERPISMGAGPQKGLYDVMMGDEQHTGKRNVGVSGLIHDILRFASRGYICRSSIVFTVIRQFRRRCPA